MNSPATQFAQDLVAALREISTGNGYQTSLGDSVFRGFYAHVLDKGQTVDGNPITFPAIVVHPGVEEITSVHGMFEKAMVRYTVPLVIAAELTIDETAYDVLQACAYDVRRAVMRNVETIAKSNQRDSLEVGAVEPDISRDSRYALAAMTVALTNVEHY